MDKLLLENGLSYLVVVDCVYNEKKYLYLVNEVDSSDIKVVELLNDSKIKIVSDIELLKMVISKMTLEVDKIYD